MITKEEYIEAQNIVWDYENQILDSLVPPELSYVIDYIQKEGLDGRKRSREYSYRRFYMYNFLAAKYNLIQQEIGAIMKKDHSTVCSGIKTHENLTSLNDVEYEFRTREIRKLFKL